jgi:hypothetical protein
VASVCVRAVGEHHRPAERDAPELAAVAFAELRGLLEVPLGELRLNLGIRSGCGAKPHKQE